MRFWDKCKNHFKAGLLLSMLVLVVGATVVYAAGGTDLEGAYSALIVENIWDDANNDLGTRPSSITAPINTQVYVSTEWSYFPVDGFLDGTATFEPNGGVFSYEKYVYEPDMREVTFRAHYVDIATGDILRTDELTKTYDAKQQSDAYFGMISINDDRVPGYTAKWYTKEEQEACKTILEQKGIPWDKVLINYTISLGKTSIINTYEEDGGYFNRAVPSVTPDFRDLDKDEDLYIVYHKLTREIAEKSYTVQYEYYDSDMSYNSYNPLYTTSKKFDGHVGDLINQENTDVISPDMLEYNGEKYYVKEVCPKERRPSGMTYAFNDTVIGRNSNYTEDNPVIVKLVQVKEEVPDTPGSGETPEKIFYNTPNVIPNKWDFVMSAKELPDYYQGVPIYYLVSDASMRDPYAHSLNSEINHQISEETKAKLKSDGYQTNVRVTETADSFSGHTEYRFVFTHKLINNNTDEPLPETYTVIYQDGNAGGESFGSDPDKGDTGYSVHPSLSEGTKTPTFQRWIDPNLPETDKGDRNIPRDWKDGSNQTWTFAGWKLTTRASEPNGVDGVQPTVVAADANADKEIIYVAQWVPVNYIVRYVDKEGNVLQSFPAEGGALSENDLTPKFTGTEPEGFENWELTSRPGSTKPQLSTNEAAQRPINKADAVKTPGEDGSITYTITYTANCGNDTPPETSYKYKVLRYEVASTKTDADFAAATLIDTSAEQTSTTAEVSVAESYKSLTGYTFLNGDSHNKLTGTCTDGVTLELELYFTKDSTPPPVNPPQPTMYNLAINYLEAGTRNVLQTAFTASLRAGDTYNQASPTISGYTLVDIAQAVVSGAMPASDVTVNVLYAPAHTLTINYVDRETGEAVAPVHTETLKEGDSYEQTSPVVEGYVLADVTQSTISGTMPAESVVVTVYYVRVPQTATYTIRHMYYRNNDVLEGDVTRRYTGTVGEIIRFTSDMREPSYDGRYYDYQGYLSSTDSFELTADDARGAGQGFTLVYSRSTGGGGYTPDPTPDPKPVTPDPEPEPEPEPVIPEPEPVTPEPEPEPVTPEPEPVTPEPEPEPQPEPTPTLPDPNDPDSPDEITIEEDGVPKTYIKVWDPENEEYVYILDEDVPLADQTPKTGDDSRTALWAALAGVSLAGAAAFTFAEKKRKNR